MTKIQLKNYPKDKRSKAWTLVVYPESAPTNWRELISNMHVPWIESPEHNKDVNPDGEIKKAHWHILLMFGSKKSFSQVKEIADMLNAPIPQLCRNIVGMVRYFAHLDNPEKYQYKSSDIVGHCGADPTRYLTTPEQEKQDHLRRLEEMLDYVEEHNVIEFYDLVNYARLERPEWFEDLAEQSTFFMTNVIKSKHFKNHQDWSKN